MRRSASMLAFVMPLAAGCATRQPPPSVVAAPAARVQGWQGIVRADDRARLDALPAGWARSLAAVPRSMTAKVKAEGPLLSPTVALPMPALPPGPYHCRLLRFGGRAGFAASAPDICYVEVRAAGLSFDKQTGATRFEGWLYPDGETRQVFLGSLRPRPSMAAPGYGTQVAADMAGAVERVAPFRWRLALPRGPRAGLDVYELVPVTPTVTGAKPAVPAPSG